MKVSSKHESIHSVPHSLPKKMKTLCWVDKDKLEMTEKDLPKPGPLDALIKVTCTTVCGTDVHIKKGSLPVSSGRTLGHEAVGVVVSMGDGVDGYEKGDRVLVSAITPCGTCVQCQEDSPGHCGGKATSGFRLGYTQDGAMAEYMIVPYARYNMAKIPDHMRDADVLLCSDVLSTGFAGAERGRVRVGDTVAVFAEGPIGLAATMAARMMGATTIIGVEHNPKRIEMAKCCGADHVLDFKKEDVCEQIMKLTKGEGVDVAIEALGSQDTFSQALSVIKPGGIVSSLGVYGENLTIDKKTYAHGIGDKQIVSSLCPGGKARMARMMRVVESKRCSHLSDLVTHCFTLDQCLDAFQMFEGQKDNVLKVAIFPHGIPDDMKSKCRKQERE